MLPTAYRLDVLPDATARVLRALSARPAIGAFVLVGGTAIALHHAHRQSEDVDLLLPGMRLPRQIVSAVVEHMAASGFDVTPATDLSALQQWEIEGEDLLDHQQDWAMDGVKVTFVALDDWPIDAARVAPPLDRLPILGSPALFESKARLLTRRTASRDMFDIWFYLAHGGRSIADVVRLAAAGDRFYTLDLVRKRLVPDRLPLSDPGFRPLLPDAPKDAEDLKGRLAAYLDAHEADLAAEALAKAVRPPEG